MDTKNTSAHKSQPEADESDVQKVKAEAKPESKFKPKHTGRKDSCVKEEPESAIKKEKREKKVFELPGQTKETPPETDPLRKFYTSLLEQRPESEMAMKWCLMYGVLSEDEALDVQKKLGKSASRPTPVKPAVKREIKEEPKAGSSKRPRSKKIKYEDDDSSDEDEPIAKSRPKKASVKKDDGDDDDGDDDDKPLSKTLEAKKKLASKKAIRVKGPPDSAFTDGGLDKSSDDSDDELPLATRMKKK